MLWYVIIGTLAAFGGLCAAWVVLGGLLPDVDGGLIVWFCEPEQTEAVAKRCRWLRELGLVRSKIVIIGDTQAVKEKLEQELERIDAAGNGDPPGHHRSGGVSEL